MSISDTKNRRDENMNHRLGCACHIKHFKDSEGFVGTTIKALEKLPIEDRVKLVKQKAIINLERTLRNIKYCIQNGFEIYRLSSDIIPRATYIEQYWDWSNDEYIVQLCNNIKLLTGLSGIRTSLHPEQSVVLTNFKDDSIFTNTALHVLDYHNKLANLCGVECILIHVGGAYGDKESAMVQFYKNFNRLPKSIQDKLHVENDKIYNLEDTLTVAEMCGIPCVVDFHHDRCKPSPQSINHYIERVFATWSSSKWNPKCHLSSGRTGDTDYSHADYLSIEDYRYFLEVTKGKCDIIVEAKMKDLALSRLREEI